MRDIFSEIRKRASQNPKRLVLPEGREPRVREAAQIIKQERIAQVVLLEDEVPNAGKYIAEYYELRKSKGMTKEEAERLFRENPVYYAAMMVRAGAADGFVAGAGITTRDVARSIIQCLHRKEEFATVSSAFLLQVPGFSFGSEGLFLFADCAVVPDPSSRQLAQIAMESASLFKSLTDITPYVAFLSYSTKGSASGVSVEKILDALTIARQRAPHLKLDGELQLDAAIIPEVAARKLKDSPVAGRANVLIFPNLDAGNIAYKLMQRLARARIAGPLFQGLKEAASDLSRGCEVQEIVDAVAITCVRAQS